MTYSRGGRRLSVTLTMAVAAIGVIPATGQASAAPPGPVAPPGSGAEVIAQGLVTFDDGEYHWRLTPSAINQTPTPIALAGSSFLLAGGPVPVLVSEAGEPTWRLGEGEAVFRPAGSSVDVVALGAGAAGLTSIMIESGADTSTFTPGSGVRDVDLVRGSLSTEASIALHADVAAFILVSSGVVNTGDTTIAAGATALVQGDFTLFNPASEPATVVVAIVGPTIDGAAPVAAEPPAATSPAPAPATSPPAPAPTAAPTTTIDPMVADVDGDGLTGADEELRGTNPDEADSDGDGLDDGSEVFDSGTNPLDADSDADGLNDRAELDDLGTNPSDEDSDDDGFLDGDEFNGGTDPNDPASHP